MKKLLTILLLFLSLASYSQKQDSLITIKGVVIDAETGEEIPFVSFKVLKSNDKIVEFQSDFDGSFNFPFFKNYCKDSILITSVGYENKTIHFQDLKGTLYINPLPYEEIIFEVFSDCKFYNDENDMINPQVRSMSEFLKSDTIRISGKSNIDIDPHQMGTGATLIAEDIEHMP